MRSANSNGVGQRVREIALFIGININIINAGVIHPRAASRGRRSLPRIAGIIRILSKSTDSFVPHVDLI